MTNKEVFDALIKVSPAVTELFKELGNKEAGDWGIINTGLIQLDHVRNTAKREEITHESR